MKNNIDEKNNMKNNNLRLNGSVKFIVEFNKSLSLF